MGIWSLPNYTQSVSETICQKMELGRGEIILKGSLKAKRWWLCVLWTGQSPASGACGRDSSCLCISLGILYKILTSGLNLDPIDNLPFFAEKNQRLIKSRHSQAHQHPSTVRATAWPRLGQTLQPNTDQTQAKSRARMGPTGTESPNFLPLCEKGSHTDQKKNWFYC